LRGFALGLSLLGLLLVYNNALRLTDLLHLGRRGLILVVLIVFLFLLKIP
jgi:hypothetical protein